jgi:hypothetical protein
MTWPDLHDGAARVRWHRITPGSEALFRLGRVLYAYIVPPKKEIVYIGKADGCRVGERWCRSAKPEFWDYLDQRGMDAHAGLVGDVELAPGRQLSRELLSDIESLLIKRLRPAGNFQAIRSRMSRPGLDVTCEGDWTHERRHFADR